MANKDLIDRGSRKHLLDLLESDCRSSINSVIARSGFQLADEPHLQPHGRQNADGWAEYEIEEFFQEPEQRISALPQIREDWWIKYKTGNNSRPTWDLIAHLQSLTNESQSGILLVEAKAHVGELKINDEMSTSTGSKESDANEKQIRKRIKETQAFLNKLNRSRIGLPFDTHFQLVNRLAYSCHLASLGYNVVLLYLGFCNGTYFDDPIVDKQHWRLVIGGYIKGVVSPLFPERRHHIKGGGSLQMLISSLPVSKISTLGER